MKCRAIHRQATDHPVNWMCRLLGINRSSYYAWRLPAKRQQTDRDAFLTSQIKAIHCSSHQAYGSPRVHRELRKQGIRTSRKRVERIMREHALVGKGSRKWIRTTVVDTAAVPAPNLLNRDFSAKAPNQKWVTDITYIATQEGWLYVSAILDLFSSRIVGFSMADHMRTELPLRALQQAIATRQVTPGLLHHSDRGCQYTSTEYRQTLQHHGLVCSMSRKGECWDNAPAESFFGRLKEELIYGRVWETKKQAADAIKFYICHFWNPKRIQKRLGFLSPVEYEISQQRSNQAA